MTKLSLATSVVAAHCASAALLDLVRMNFEIQRKFYHVLSAQQLLSRASRHVTY